ncbi:MAG: relaxase/mobilization nuclease domain-containing protein [Bacteroidota bacterium]
MVARINTAKNIAKALNYNEQKVHQGNAEILSASGFLKEADKMNFHEKLRRFQSLISLNERTETNTLHVSLNFDPSENIANGKMVEIADAYMQKIGFGDQPYLVYRHHDSGHPHIHIVSTNIERDGKRISMHNMGRNQSEKARKEIEVDFGLVKADSKKLNDDLKLIPVSAQKVIYGKSATKRAIANVLMVVIDRYKYISLAELNAVLKLYNVAADPGKDDSRMFKQKGLTYRVLDESGNKIGAPIKASAFFMKPTMNLLEKKFAENEKLKTPHKKRISTTIDWALLSKPANIRELIKVLEKESISVVLRENKEGIIYGITYVDHKTKCVFNGSDLGKAYSAKAIQGKCQPELIILPVQVEKKVQTEKQSASKQFEHETKNSFQKQDSKPIQQPTVPLNTNVFTDNSVPFEPIKKRKKKRKRISL